MFNLKKLKQLADSQLDHVLVALRADDRGYNVRDVLDPWWCLERGAPFVRQRRDGGYSAVEFNNPCAWERRDHLARFDWLSVGAKTIIDKGRDARIIDRKTHPKHLTLIVDHSVPIARICQEIWQEPRSWTGDLLRAFLVQNFRRAVISHEENQLLNIEYRSAMPAGWQIEDDPFARYSEVGIQQA